MPLGRTAHAGTELWKAKDDVLDGWSLFHNRGWGPMEVWPVIRPECLIVRGLVGKH